MIRRNTAKLLMDLEYIKKVQSELPSKFSVIFASAMQLLIGSGVLSFVIKESNQMPFKYVVFPLVVLSITLILFSAYTFFGYLIRKRYIMIIESLLLLTEEEKPE